MKYSTIFFFYENQNNLYPLKFAWIFPITNFIIFLDTTFCTKTKLFLIIFFINESIYDKKRYNSTFLFKNNLQTTSNFLTHDKKKNTHNTHTQINLNDGTINIMLMLTWMTAMMMMMKNKNPWKEKHTSRYYYLNKIYGL